MAGEAVAEFGPSALVVKGGEVGVAAETGVAGAAGLEEFGVVAAVGLVAGEAALPLVGVMGEDEGATVFFVATLAGLLHAAALLKAYGLGPVGVVARRAADQAPLDGVVGLLGKGKAHARVAGSAAFLDGSLSLSRIRRRGG